MFVNRPNLWLNWLFQVQVNASQSKRRNALDWAGGEIHIKTSSYKKRVLAHLNFSERPLWNSDTFIATFNVWSSKPFTLVFNIFWNFTSYSIHCVKFQRHACASSRIITPELTTQSCWLFKWRFFKYQYWYLKKSWCALICSSIKKKCLYKWEERKRSSTIFVKIPYTNSASVSGVAEKIDKFFTLVPEGRSIDTSIVVNFFHPMISDNFPSPKSCRECFWIITSSSININMINPKSSLFCLVSFAPPIVKSVIYFSRQRNPPVSISNQRIFQFVTYSF